MRVQWIPTLSYYREIINEKDAVRKDQLYRSRFIEPWQAMMQMMASQMPGGAGDLMDVARMWAWPMPEQLDRAPEVLIDLENADAWRIGEEALHKACERMAGFALPFDSVEGWLMIGVPNPSNPFDHGYTGSIDWTAPRFLCQYSSVDQRSLRALPGAVAHEFNHLIRLRVFPWDMAKTSVADYIVLEGIAESFATSLFGDDVLGYYVTDIGDDDLKTAKNLIRDGLEKTGFNVIRSYIFGDSIAKAYGFEKIGMPEYGGYAVGYHVVQAYLKRTGSSIEEATLTPASEIIARSGYF